jgi:hypothetical protein
VRQREAALDFMSATEASLEGYGDPDVLEFTANQGHILEALLLVWSASSPGEWASQIHYLPPLARHDFRR